MLKLEAWQSGVFNTHCITKPKFERKPHLALQQDMVSYCIKLSGPNNGIDNLAIYFLPDPRGAGHEMSFQVLCNITATYLYNRHIPI